MLDRHGEHLAAGGDKQALAAGRNADPLDIFSDVFPARSPAGQARIQRDLEHPLVTALNIELMQAAAGLVDHSITMAVGPNNIPVLLVGQSLNLTTAGVESKQVEALVVAIGNKDHPVTQPEWLKVIDALAGNIHHLRAVRIDDAHRGRGAAAIASPAGRAAIKAVVGRSKVNIGQALAVGMPAAAKETCIHLPLGRPA